MRQRNPDAPFGAVPKHKGNRAVSNQEAISPRRRSSAANRRRRKQGVGPAPIAQESVQQSSIATAEVPVAEPVERVERHIQRRDERKAAKTKKPERKGVGRVVDTKRLSGVEKFYHDTMSEIRKVQWPDRQQTLNLTLLVIALSVVLGVLLGGIDFVLLQLFETVG